MKLHFLNRFIVPLIEIWINFIGRTMKCEYIGSSEYPTREDFFKEPHGQVYTLCHGRILYPIFFVKNFNFTAMISNSKDGELISKAVQRLHIYAVRGSSSKNGHEAMYKLIDMVNHNYKIAMIVDGPRGPINKVKPGSIRIAQCAGCSIVPVSYSCTRGIFMPSWDRFLVPLPWSKGVFIVGDSIQVPKEITDTEFENLRLKLEERLIELNQKADQLCNRDPEKEVCTRFKKHKKNKHNS